LQGSDFILFFRTAFPRSQAPITKDTVESASRFSFGESSGRSQATLNSSSTHTQTHTIQTRTHNTNTLEVLENNLYTRTVHPSRPIQSRTQTH